MKTMRRFVQGYGKGLSIALAYIFLFQSTVWALPEGGAVESGSVQFDTSVPNTLNITSATDQAIINWQSFNIAQNETVNFSQPSALSAILNRVIGGGGASSIAGVLNSNGTIILVNPAGISIAETANINVGAFNSAQAASFVASSLNISSSDFRAGNYVFQKEAMLSAAVINKGIITVNGGGLVMLFGGSVENSGTINAKLGKVVLASGDKITVNFTQNGLISVAVDEKVVGGVVTADGKTVKDAVKNLGSINADGGQVILTAEAVSGIFDRAVNNEGIVKANTAVYRNGVVELISTTGKTVNKGVVQAKGTAAAPNGGTVKVYGTQTIHDGVIDVGADNGGTAGKVTVNSDVGGTILMPNSLIDASGHQIMSNAGEVLINSLGNTIFAPDALIDISGGLVSGDAGFAEVSAHQYLGYYGWVIGFAQEGYKHGTVLLDPYNVIITATANSSYAYPYTSDPIADAYVDSRISGETLVAALSYSDVTITTGSSGGSEGNITIASALDWSSASGYYKLTLNAANDINISAPVTAKTDFILIAGGDISGGFQPITGGQYARLDLTAGGEIYNLGTISVGGNIVFAADRGIDLRGSITSGSAVTHTAGYIQIISNIGAITGDGNSITNHGEHSTQNFIELKGVALQSIGALTTYRSPISLEGDSITINGDVSGYNGVSFYAPGGTIYSGNGASVTSANSNVSMTAGAGEITGFGAISGHTGVTLAASERVTLGGALYSSGLGDISITAGTGISAGSYSFTADAARVLLTANTGNISNVGTVTADGDVVIEAKTGSISLAGDITSGDADTHTGGYIQLKASQGTITGNNYSITNNGNEAEFDWIGLQGGDLDSIGALTAYSSWVALSGSDITLNGAVSGPQFVEISGTGITGGGSNTVASANGHVWMTASAGSITGFGAISADEEIMLSAPNQAVMTWGGDFSSLAGNGISLTAGSIAGPGAGTPIDAGTGSFTLDAQSGSITGFGDISADGYVVISATNGIMQLEGGAIVLRSGSDISVDTPTITATGAVTMANESPAGKISITGVVDAGGDIDIEAGSGGLDTGGLTSAGAVYVHNEIAGGAATTVNFNGPVEGTWVDVILGSNGTINAPNTSTVTANDGDIVLNASAIYGTGNTDYPMHASGVVQIIADGGGSVNFLVPSAGGTVTLETVNGGDLTLNCVYADSAAGLIVQAPDGAITLNNMVSNSNGGITMSAGSGITGNWVEIVANAFDSYNSDITLSVASGTMEHLWLFGKKVTLEATAGDLTVHGANAEEGAGGMIVKSPGKIYITSTDGGDNFVMNSTGTLTIEAGTEIHGNDNIIQAGSSSNKALALKVQEGTLDGMSDLWGSTVTLEATAGGLSAGGVVAQKATSGLTVKANSELTLTGAVTNKTGHIALQAGSLIDGGGQAITAISGAGNIGLSVSDGTISNIGTLSAAAAGLTVSGEGGTLLLGSGLTTNLSGGLGLFAGAGRYIDLNGWSVQNSGPVAVTGGGTMCGIGLITSTGSSVLLQNDFAGQDLVFNAKTDVTGAGATAITSNVSVSLTATDGSISGFGAIAADSNVTLDAHTLTLGGDISSRTGDIAVTGGVTLGADISLHAGNKVTLNDTVNDDVAGTHALAVTADVGLCTFAGAVGSDQALKSLSVSGAAALNGGAFTTTGAQTYGGAVTLGDNTALTGAAITFGGSLDGAFSLELNDSGTTQFNGIVGGETPLAALTTDGAGTTEINTTAVTTTGAQGYGDALSLGSETTLTGTTITFAAPVTGTDINLTVNGSSDTIVINGGSVDTGTGDQTYNAPVVIGADTVLTGGDIFFNDTLDNDDSGTFYSLEVNAQTSPVYFEKNVGGIHELGSLAVNAPYGIVINCGSIETAAGGITLTGPVTLGADVVMDTHSSGDISFIGNVNGTFDLTLYADGHYAGVMGNVGTLDTMDVWSDTFDITGSYNAHEIFWNGDPWPPPLGPLYIIVGSDGSYNGYVIDNLGVIRPTRGWDETFYLSYDVFQELENNYSLEALNDISVLEGGEISLVYENKLTLIAGRDLLIGTNINAGAIDCVAGRDITGSNLPSLYASSGSVSLTAATGAISGLGEVSGLGASVLSPYAAVTWGGGEWGGSFTWLSGRDQGVSITALSIDGGGAGISEENGAVNLMTTGGDIINFGGIWAGDYVSLSPKGNIDGIGQIYARGDKQDMNGYTISLMHPWQTIGSISNVGALTAEKGIITLIADTIVGAGSPVNAAGMVQIIAVAGGISGFGDIAGNESVMLNTNNGGLTLDGNISSVSGNINLFATNADINLNWRELDAQTEIGVYAMEATGLNPFRCDILNAGSVTAGENVNLNASGKITSEGGQVRSDNAAVTVNAGSGISGIGEVTAATDITIQSSMGDITGAGGAVYSLSGPVMINVPEGGISGFGAISSENAGVALIATGGDLTLGGPVSGLGIIMVSSGVLDVNGYTVNANGNDLSLQSEAVFNGVDFTDLDSQFAASTLYFQTNTNLDITSPVVFTGGNLYLSATDALNLNDNTIDAGANTLTLYSQNDGLNIGSIDFTKLNAGDLVLQSGVGLTVPGSINYTGGNLSLSAGGDLTGTGSPSVEASGSLSLSAGTGAITGFDALSGNNGVTLYSPCADVAWDGTAFNSLSGNGYGISVTARNITGAGATVIDEENGPACLYAQGGGNITGFTSIKGKSLTFVSPTASIEWGDGFLDSYGGGITLSALNIAGNSLSISETGDVYLSTWEGGTLGGFGDISGTTVTLQSQAPLTLGGTLTAATGGVNVTANGIDAASYAIDGGAGGVSLYAPQGDISNLSTVAAGGNISLTAMAGGISSSDLTPPDLTVTDNGGVYLYAGVGGGISGLGNITAVGENGIIHINSVYNPVTWGETFTSLTAVNGIVMYGHTIDAAGTPVDGGAGCVDLSAASIENLSDVTAGTYIRLYASNGNISSVSETAPAITANGGYVGVYAYGSGSIGDFGAISACGEDGYVSLYSQSGDFTYGTTCTSLYADSGITISARNIDMQGSDLNGGSGYVQLISNYGDITNLSSVSAQGSIALQASGNITPFDLFSPPNITSFNDTVSLTAGGSIGNLGEITAGGEYGTVYYNSSTGSITWGETFTSMNANYGIQVNAQSIDMNGTPLGVSGYIYLNAASGDISNLSTVNAETQIQLNASGSISSADETPPDLTVNNGSLYLYAGADGIDNLGALTAGGSGIILVNVAGGPVRWGSDFMSLNADNGMQISGSTINMNNMPVDGHMGYVYLTASTGGISNLSTVKAGSDIYILSSEALKLGGSVLSAAGNVDINAPGVDVNNKAVVAWTDRTITFTTTTEDFPTNLDFGNVTAGTVQLIATDMTLPAETITYTAGNLSFFAAGGTLDMSNVTAIDNGTDTITLRSSYGQFSGIDYGKLTAGTVSLESGADLTVPAAVVFDGNLTFKAEGAGTLTVDGAAVNAGANTITLYSGAGSFVGPVFENLAAGAVILESGNNLTVPAEVVNFGEGSVKFKAGNNVDAAGMEDITAGAVTFSTLWGTLSGIDYAKLHAPTVTQESEWGSLDISGPISYAEGDLVFKASGQISVNNNAIDAGGHNITMSVTDGYLYGMGDLSGDTVTLSATGMYGNLILSDAVAADAPGGLTVTAGETGTVLFVSDTIPVTNTGDITLSAGKGIYGAGTAPEIGVAAIESTVGNVYLKNDFTGHHFSAAAFGNFSALQDDGETRSAINAGTKHDITLSVNSGEISGLGPLTGKTVSLLCVGTGADLTVSGNVEASAGDLIVNAGEDNTLTLDNAYISNTKEGGTLTLEAVGGITGIGATTLDASGTVTVNNVFSGISLSVTGGAATALNGGAVTTTGAQGYAGPVTLGVDTVLNGEGITFDSTLDGGYTLAINDSGTTTFGGIVGGAGEGLKSLTTDAFGTTHINCAKITAFGNTIVFNDPVVIDTDTTIEDLGTGITFNNSVSASAEGLKLTLNAPSGAVVYGDVEGPDFRFLEVNITSETLRVAGGEVYTDPAATTLLDTESDVVNGTTDFWRHDGVVEYSQIWPSPIYGPFNVYIGDYDINNDADLLSRDGTIVPGPGLAETFYLTWGVFNDSLGHGYSITADNDITIDAGGSISLSYNLTLIAGNDLFIASPVTAGSLNLTAANNITGSNSAALETTAGAVVLEAAAGSISGLGTVESTGGNIDMTAGTNISLGANVACLSADRNITFNDAVVLADDVAVSASGTGIISFEDTLDVNGKDITVTANAIDIKAAVTGADGTITLQPADDDASIGIGGAAGTLQLTAAEIGYLDGFSTLTIGRETGQHEINIHAITFKDPVTISSPVAGGAINVNGKITGTGNASVTINGSGATTTLGADIVTASQPITIDDAVTVANVSNINLDTTTSGTGANIWITGPVDGTVAGSNGLTFKAGTGNVTLDGAVGGTTRLGAFKVTSAKDLTTDAITAASISHLGTGKAKFGGALDCTAYIGVVTTGGDIEGVTTEPITSWTSTVSLSAASGGMIKNLGAITAGYVGLNGSNGIDTVGDIVSEGNILIGGNAIYVNSDSGHITGLHGLKAENAGNITVRVNNYGLSGTAGSQIVAYGYAYFNSEGSISNLGNITANGNSLYDGSYSVWIRAATGSISNLEEVTADLGNVYVYGGGGLTMAGDVTASAGNVAITGTATLNDNICLTGNTVTLNSSVNDDTVGTHGLKLTGNCVLSGTVGATTAIKSLSVSGTTALNGGSVKTTETQGYGGAVTLGANTTLTGAGITFDAEVDGAKTLAINDSGTTTFGGIVGGGTALASLTTDAAGTTAINTTAITTTGAQDYKEAVTLGGDTTLTGSTITFGDTVNGNYRLMLYGNCVFNGVVGDADALSSLYAYGDTTTMNGGSITTTGMQYYFSGGAVTLDRDTILTSTMSSLDGFVFFSTINGGHNLSLNAGAGAVTITGMIGNTAPLSSLNITTTNAAGITQSDAWKAGSMNLNAGAAAITLINASNDFTGAVSLTNTGSNNVQITDANELTLGTLSIGGALTAKSTGAMDLGAGTVGGVLSATSNGGAITQTITEPAVGLTVTGASTFAAGAGDITLDDPGNNFSSVSIASGKDVTINDKNDISLAASSVSGTYGVIAGGRVDLDAPVTAGAIDFHGGSGITGSGSPSLETTAGRLYLHTDAGDISGLGTLTASDYVYLESAENIGTIGDVAAAGNNLKDGVYAVWILGQGNVSGISAITADTGGMYLNANLGALSGSGAASTLTASSGGGTGIVNLAAFYGISGFGAVSAPDQVYFQTAFAGDIELGGDIASSGPAGTVSLAAIDGVIDLNGKTIDATTSINMEVNNTAAPSSGSIVDLGPLTAGTDISLRASGSISSGTAPAVTSTGGSVNVISWSSGSIAGLGAVTARDNVTMSAEAGGITLGGGLTATNGYIDLTAADGIDAGGQTLIAGGTQKYFDDTVNINMLLTGADTSVTGIGTLDADTGMRIWSQNGPLTVGGISMDGMIRLVATADGSGVTLDGDLQSNNSWVMVENNTAFNAAGRAITAGGLYIDASGNWNINITFEKDTGGTASNLGLLTGAVLSRIYSENGLTVNGGLETTGPLELGAGELAGVACTGPIIAGGEVNVTGGTAIDLSGQGITANGGASNLTLSVNNGVIGNAGTLTGQTVTLQVVGDVGELPPGLEVTGSVTADADQLELLAGGGRTLTLTDAAITNNTGDVVITSEDQTITGNGATVLRSVGGDVQIQSDFNGGALTVTADAGDIKGWNTGTTMLTSSGALSLNAPNGTVSLFGDIEGAAGVSLNSGGGLTLKGSVSSTGRDISITTHTAGVTTEGGNWTVTADNGSILIMPDAGDIDGLGDITGRGSVRLLAEAGGITLGGDVSCGDPVAQTGQGLDLVGRDYVSLNGFSLANYGTGDDPAVNYLSVLSVGGAVQGITNITTNGVPVSIDGAVIITNLAVPAVIDATAAGDVTFANSPVGLMNDLTVTGDTVTFENSVCGIKPVAFLPGAYSLQIHAQTAAVFSGDVGGEVPPPYPPVIQGTISDLTVDGPLTTGAGCALIKTDGAQVYGGAVTLGADTTLTGTDITFWDPLDSDGTPRDLIVNTAGGGVTHFCGDVGAVSPLKSLTTNGDGRTDISCGGLNVNGNTITFNDPVQLLETTTITEAVGDITFNDRVYGTGAGLGLTLTAGGNVIYGAAAGGPFELGNVDMTASGLTVNGTAYLDPASTTLTGAEALIVNGAAVWWNTFQIWPATPPGPTPVPGVLSVISGIDLGWLTGLLNEDIQRSLTEAAGLPEQPKQPLAPQIRLGLDPFLPGVQYNVMQFDTISFTLQPPSAVERLAYNISAYEELLRGAELGSEIEVPARTTTDFDMMMNPLIPAMGTFVNLSGTTVGAFANLGGGMASALWWKRKK
jgi:filamentous hemagglutinin family protein